jgi:hypothetical protein
MIIIKEKKRSALSEDTGKVLLRDFVKTVGKRTACRAEWTSKSGFTNVAADSPAFCGFNNGYFYLATAQGNLSVNFQARSIISVTKEFYDDGMPDQYHVLIRDGSKIMLNLLFLRAIIFRASLFKNGLTG